MHCKKNLHGDGIMVHSNLSRVEKSEPYEWYYVTLKEYEESRKDVQRETQITNTSRNIVLEAFRIVRRLLQVNEYDISHNKTAEIHFLDERAHNLYQGQQKKEQRKGDSIEGF
ncbi:hypothetical protein K435DRAFT_794970 [Dendrothele bispora CBS 962.96]|uniref:Uncharacterized protein n=1 Tax=Dendrothele bispora (strain CBS 962.96) TaxID=1314807 RepID=A0A4S8MBJ2_DENBC|nr:hypothetical protein K435DRAFT_794970 [Dendrothele bispora CBS 962.96]